MKRGGSPLVARIPANFGAERLALAHLAAAKIAASGGNLAKSSECFKRKPQQRQLK